MNREKMNIRRRFLSFVYAYKGIKYFFSSQANAWIHSFATICVLAFGVIFDVTKTEWCLLLLSIGIVFMAEMINTAIEVFIDYVSPSYHISAGRAKDLAAGGVLFAAIIAAIVGLIIFIPKILAIF